MYLEHTIDGEEYEKAGDFTEELIDLIQNWTPKPIPVDKTQIDSKEKNMKEDTENFVWPKNSFMCWLVPLMLLISFLIASMFR